MNFEIVEQTSFEILAMSREFSTDDSMAEIPKFWQEYYARGNGNIACGQYGICYGENDNGDFRYAIGNRCTPANNPDSSTVYHISNCSDRAEIPDGFELLSIPAGTWAKFECLGPLPQSIQNIWQKIEKEWKTDTDYEKRPGFQLEEYGKCQCPEDAQKSDYKCFIWIPVRRRLTVQINTLSASDFIRLFQAPGWEAPGEEQVDIALKNSRSVFSLYSGKELIGMGRLIGDRSMAYMVRDIVILPEYQNQGAGAFLIKTMLDWIAHDLPAGWRISCELFATAGNSGFYQKFGFENIPNQLLECGMMQMVEGVE